MLNTNNTNASHVQDTSLAASSGNDMPQPPFIFERHGKLLQVHGLDDALNRLLDAVDNLNEYTKAAAKVYSAMLSSNTEFDGSYKYEFHLLQCMLEMIQSIESGME